ncbi:SMI1/KNR4 family protein [Sessilibacter sp. MAH2]
MIMKEDVLEKLANISQSTLLPIPQATMDDIVDAQEEMLVSFPAEFRDFLISVSHMEVGSIEPVTLSDPELHTYLPEMASQAWELGLPRDLLPLCRVEDGFYVVTLADQVEFWRIEDQDFSGDIWESIWQWADEVWLES